MTFSGTRTDYIPGLAFFIPLKPLRRTPNVEFDLIPVVPHLDSIDRVLHQPGARSPTIAGRDEHLWYMHPSQDDNLLVFHGKRIVELWSTAHPHVETFEVTPEKVMHGDKVVYDGPCIFGWPVNAFHRVKSPEGSISLNFAQHSEGFDIDTNFSIYELNTETGEYKVVREGHLDQNV